MASLSKLLLKNPGKIIFCTWKFYFMPISCIWFNLFGSRKKPKLKMYDPMLGQALLTMTLVLMEQLFPSPTSHPSVVMAIKGRSCGRLWSCWHGNRSMQIPALPRQPFEYGKILSSHQNSVRIISTRQSKKVSVRTDTTNDLLLRKTWVTDAPISSPWLLSIQQIQNETQKDREYSSIYNKTKQNRTSFKTRLKSMFFYFLAALFIISLCLVALTSKRTRNGTQFSLPKLLESYGGH